MSEQDPLHPESLRTLRKLIRLHGAERLIAATKEIQARERTLPPDEVLDEIARAFKAVFCPDPSEEVLNEIAKSWLEHARHFPINEALHPDADQP